MEARAVVVLMLACAMSPSLYAQEAGIDASASSILQSMSDYLKGADELGFRADIVYDAVSPDGQKLQYGGTAEVALRRPNRLHVEYNGDENSRTIVIDGRTFYTTVVYSGTTEYLYVNGAYYVPTTKPAEQPATTQSASAGSDDPSDIPMLDDEGENYEVVASPVGATVPYLPEGAHEETVAGKRYFVSGGTYYQPFAGEGETIYMVVADPRGTA